MFTVFVFTCVCVYLYLPVCVSDRCDSSFMVGGEVSTAQYHVLAARNPSSIITTRTHRGDTFSRTTHPTITSDYHIAADHGIDTCRCVSLWKLNLDVFHVFHILYLFQILTKYAYEIT